MNKIYRLLFIFILLWTSVFSSAKKLDLISLENRIVKNNREGKQQTSQEELSRLILDNDLSNREEASVLLFMAYTYRSITDYLSCIDYLDKSKAIAEKLSDNETLLMEINYEYAFAYFDNNDYKKSKSIMEYIQKQNYKNASLENQSYLLMQEGFLLMMENQFQKSEKKYKQAYEMTKKANACNLPVVLVKMMELSNKQNQISKTEGYYEESLKWANQCNILKYKILSYGEMERIYKDNNLYNKAYIIGKKLDSLRKIENLEATIAQMHLADKKLLEQEQQNHEHHLFLRRLIIILSLVVFFLMGRIWYLKKYGLLKKAKHKLKEDKQQMEKELFYQSDKNNSQKLDNKYCEFFEDFNKLTERQVDLFHLIAEGFSNKEIADKMFITESTVKYHIRNIYTILEIKDRRDFFKKIRKVV